MLPIALPFPVIYSPICPCVLPFPVLLVVLECPYIYIYIYIYLTYLRMFSHLGRYRPQSRSSCCPSIPQRIAFRQGTHIHPNHIVLINIYIPVYFIIHPIPIIHSSILPFILPYIYIYIYNIVVPFPCLTPCL